MKFFALFTYRPVATILISLAITLCGVLGFRLLPVAPLPQVDFPVLVSQVLTLFTTPVIYLLFDRLALWTKAASRNVKRRHK